ncbi:MAG: transposase [Ignavibacteria bacterium]|nr:transposase [Ignavibacteria bacterium]
MRVRYFHRRNLPHLHYNKGDYFVTFRLKDSLPLSELKRLKEELEKSSEELSIKGKKIFKKYDDLLDSGKYGSDYLRSYEIANIIKDVINKYDNVYFELICFCIMPNHVHLVFTILDSGKTLSDIMKKIKGSTAIIINRHLKKEGSLWQAESFDRLIREEKELYNIIKYVLLNPVKANLVADWKDWKHTYCHPSFMVI